MITYDDYLQNCYDLASDQTSSTLAFIKRVGNAGYRRAMKLFGKSFEERTKTAVTVALQQYYQLPADYSFMKSVKVLVGTLSYPLEEVKSQEEWDNLNRMTNISNTRPTKYFIRLNLGIAGDEVGFWPTPSAAGNTITLVYEAIPKNLGVVANTTGVVTMVNNSTAVSGTSTTFNPQMPGRFLYISDENTGDGNYYRIGSYNSSTSLTLQNYYEGPSISAVNFGIYELFALPEECQMIPVYYTMWHYYLMRQNAKLAGAYKQLHDADLKEAMRNQAAKSHDGVVRRGRDLNLAVDYPLWFPGTITSNP